MIELNNLIVIGATARLQSLQEERSRVLTKLRQHLATPGPIGWFLRRHYWGKLTLIDFQIRLHAGSVEFAQKTLG